MLPAVWDDSLLSSPGVFASNGAGRGGRPATLFAATGADIDEAEIPRLLDDCQLTDEEMRSAIAGLADPFHLYSTQGADNKRTP